MLHNIITIMTASAIALHAMLGCCAHHTHCPATNSLGFATQNDCQQGCQHGSHSVCKHASETHGHPNHMGCSCEPLDGFCDQDHGNDSHRQPCDHSGCSEGKCSFASNHRTIDLNLILASKGTVVPFGDTVQCASASLVHSWAGRLANSPSACAQVAPQRALIQVWRL